MTVLYNNVQMFTSAPAYIRPRNCSPVCPILPVYWKEERDDHFKSEPIDILQGAVTVMRVLNTQHLGMTVGILSPSSVSSLHGSLILATRSQGNF